MKSRCKHFQKICYLCGHTIESEGSADHVPPEGFYPKDKSGSLTYLGELPVLPAHIPCQTKDGINKDEEFFMKFILPFCSGSIAETFRSNNTKLWWDEIKEYKRKNDIWKNGRVPDPSYFTGKKVGVPGLNNVVGRVITPDESDRIVRVIEKIARGRIYMDCQKLAPSGCCRKVTNPLDIRGLPGLIGGKYKPTYKYMRCSHPKIFNIGYKNDIKQNILSIHMLFLDALEIQAFIDTKSLYDVPIHETL